MIIAVGMIAAGMIAQADLVSADNLDRTDDRLEVNLNTMEGTPQISENGVNSSSAETLTGSAAAMKNRVNGLRCEFMINPQGVTQSNPALSWMIEDGRRGAGQTAYQVQVASSLEDLLNGKATLWDSKKVHSEQSHLVRYEGKNLTSLSRVWWRVKYWDQDGKESEWSEAAWWITGFFASDEFQGEWIGAIEQFLPEGEAELQWVKDATIPEAFQWVPEQYQKAGNAEVIKFTEEQLKLAKPVYSFRREFTIDEPVESALLAICSLGYHEITVNGKPIDDHRLEPSFSHYEVNADYSVKDITQSLKIGSNCLGILMGNGRYNEMPGYKFPPESYGTSTAFKAMVMIRTVSGKQIVLSSDLKWKSDISTITRDSFWVGQVQDARRLQFGWNLPGFNDSGWKGVRTVTTKIPTNLNAQLYPAEAETERLEAISLTNPAPGVWVYDFGRTIVGNAQLTIEAPRGTMVSVRYAHLLWGTYPDWYRKNNLFNPSYDDMTTARSPGMIVAKLRGDTLTRPISQFFKGEQSDWTKRKLPYVMNADLFVTGGSGIESFQRRFGYRPFRYVEVRGIPGKPDLHNITAVALHTRLEKSDPQPTGFTCSNPLFNAIADAGRKTVLYNLHGHGQDNAGAEKGFFAYNTAFGYYQYTIDGEFAPVARKVMREVRAMTESRGLASVFTSLRKPRNRNSIPDFMTISEMQHYITIPWEYYIYSGDLREIQNHYKVIKEYIAYIYKDVATKGYLLDDGYGDAWDGSASFDLPENYRFVEGEGYRPATKRRGTPKEFYATVFGYHMVYRAAILAQLLNEKEDAKHFETIRDNARSFIQERFFDPSGPYYCKGATTTIQGSHSAAVYWDVAEDKDKKALVDKIVDDLQKNRHLTTCNRLSYFLLDVLSAYGDVDAAYEIMNRQTYPSLAHQISYYGTIPENWGYPNLPSVGSPAQLEGMAVMPNWFYAWVCGVRPDLNIPGFKHFFVTPKIPSKLDAAKMAMECNYGRIAVEWQKLQGQFRFALTVPPNTTATVAIPIVAGTENPVIMEGKFPLENAPGVRVIKKAKDEVVCEVQSGSYDFSYEL